MGIGMQIVFQTIGWFTLAFIGGLIAAILVERCLVKRLEEFCNAIPKKT